ncbi:LamG-like jellyroll fold domain-containing protein [Lentisalinibacter salinarum]|uniref:LamG-like jellyroll fold domain-containing protein n=1 Tax=Lentisalinibacter salinarum TaxID=2992239 RepID=UPI0038694F5A
MPLDGSLESRGSVPTKGELITQGGEPATSAPEYREGRFGQSIHFSGEEAVRVPLDVNYELYPQITITAWIYSEGEPHGYLFSNRSRSGPTLNVWKSGVGANGPGLQLTQSGILRPGRWLFVAGVWDTEAGIARLHYDRRSKEGELKDRVEEGALDIWIGAWDDSLLSQVEDIRIDDVRVYDHALTPEELEGLWLGSTDTGSDLVRKKPGRTTSDAPGEQETSVSAAGQTGSAAIGTTEGAPTAQPGDDLLEARRAGTTTDGDASADSGSDMLTGSLPSASEIQQSASEQPDMTSGDAIRSGRTELERSLEDGREAASASASATEGAVGSAITGPTVEQFLKPLAFDVAPSGDVTACGGFATIFNPLLKKNRENIFILGRSCALLDDAAESLANEIGSRTFLNATPCDTPEQFRQRIGQAFEADGEGLLDSDKLRGLECAAGFLFSRVTNACISASQAPVSLVEDVISWYNNWLTNDGPASLGPRAIRPGQNSGTVLAPGDRRWFTPTVLQTNRATVGIRREDGQARVVARICKVNSMNEFKFVDEITFDSDSPDISLNTVDDVEGHFITVFMQTKGGPANTGRRMGYTLELNY